MASPLTAEMLDQATRELEDEAAAILAALPPFPRLTATLTVSVDIMGGLTLPDGSRLSELRVERTATPDGEVHNRAEGWVIPAGPRTRPAYRRLAVSLVAALLPAPEPA